jgi:hypothetical protein
MPSRSPRYVLLPPPVSSLLYYLFSLLSPYTLIPQSCLISIKGAAVEVENRHGKTCDALVPIAAVALSYFRCYLGPATMNTQRILMDSRYDRRCLQLFRRL